MTKEEFINLSSEERAKRLAQHQRSLEVDQKISEWEARIEAARNRRYPALSTDESRPIYNESSTSFVAKHTLELLEGGIIPVGKFVPFKGLKGVAFEEAAKHSVEAIKKLEEN